MEIADEKQEEDQDVIAKNSQQVQVELALALDEVTLVQLVKIKVHIPIMFTTKDTCNFWKII